MLFAVAISVNVIVMKPSFSLCTMHIKAHNCGACDLDMWWCNVADGTYMYMVTSILTSQLMEDNVLSNVHLYIL